MRFDLEEELFVTPLLNQKRLSPKTHFRHYLKKTHTFAIENTSRNVFTKDAHFYTGLTTKRKSLQLFLRGNGIWNWILYVKNCTFTITMLY